jgi:hypothetical protein
MIHGRRQSIAADVDPIKVTIVSFFVCSLFAVAIFYLYASRAWGFLQGKDEVS